jgi:hypothetical protein
VSDKRAKSAGAFSAISYVRASSTNGIQPAPLSTDTIRRPGCRSSIPEQMMLTTLRAFPRKSIVPAIASCSPSLCDPHAYFSKKLIAVWLLPMWKCTGSSSSSHVAQSGSHTGSARSGAPWSDGSAVMFTPRKPRPLARRASRTQSPTSHAGITAIGSNRPPDCSISPAPQSL